jgi:hypothetical protein
MVFSSVIFLFAYLPLVLFFYHLLFVPVWRGYTHRRWRTAANLFLLSVSLVFYFWGEKLLVSVFAATVVIDYFCALLIANALFRNDYTKRSYGVMHVSFVRCAQDQSDLSRFGKALWKWGCFL